MRLRKNQYFISFVDFNVIFLLVSMMILVLIATKSGVFTWMANELLKLTKGKPIRILFALGLFTAIVSAFLDNVTTVILIMPVTFAIAKELGICESKEQCYTGADVEVDENLITANGPKSAFEFALAICEYLGLNPAF